MGNTCCTNDQGQQRKDGVVETMTPANGATPAASKGGASPTQGLTPRGKKYYTQLSNFSAFADSGNNSTANSEVSSQEGLAQPVKQRSASNGASPTAPIAGMAMDPLLPGSPTTSIESAPPQTLNRVNTMEGSSSMSGSTSKETQRPSVISVELAS